MTLIEKILKKFGISIEDIKRISINLNKKNFQIFIREEIFVIFKKIR